MSQPLLLTHAERAEIRTLSANGANVFEIADHLHLSAETVRDFLTQPPPLKSKSECAVEGCTRPRYISGSGKKYLYCLECNRRINREQKRRNATPKANPVDGRAYSGRKRIGASESEFLLVPDYERGTYEVYEVVSTQRGVIGARWEHTKAILERKGMRLVEGGK